MPARTVAEAESVWAWRRDERVQRLGWESYAAYLRSPEWAALRKRYFRKRHDGFVGCELCSSSDRIVLHHRTYERVGAEELSDLVPLCPTCHEFVHGLERDGYIDSLDPSEIAALEDAERQRRNRKEQAKRKAQSEQDPRQLGEDQQRQRIHSLTRRLRQALVIARERGVDVTAERAMIDELITRIGTKKP